MHDSALHVQFLDTAHGDVEKNSMWVSKHLTIHILPFWCFDFRQNLLCGSNICAMTKRNHDSRITAPKSSISGIFHRFGKSFSGSMQLIHPRSMKFRGRQTEVPDTLWQGICCQLPLAGSFWTFINSSAIRRDDQWTRWQAERHKDYDDQSWSITAMKDVNHSNANGKAAPTSERRHMTLRGCGLWVVGSIAVTPRWLVRHWCHVAEWIGYSTGYSDRRGDSLEATPTPWKVISMRTNERLPERLQSPRYPQVAEEN